MEEAAQTLGLPLTRFHFLYPSDYGLLVEQS